MFKTTIEKTVYLVRHGQSVDNASPVFQADDSPLSDVGKRQAERIAERVSNLNFQALIASPFVRARQTADAIAWLTGMEPVYSDLFVERRKPTSISGKSFTDETANTIWRAWTESLYQKDTHIEDGENFEDIVLRADSALTYLGERNEQSLVVVTHGFFLRTIVARVMFGEHLTDEVFKNFKQLTIMENTGLTVIRYQNDFESEPCWKLWIYNDHAHLAE